MIILINCFYYDYYYNDFILINQSIKIIFLIQDNNKNYK